MRPSPSLLVSAGEASGDEMAADVVRRLGVPAFGLGGAELARAGIDVRADAATTAVMGALGPLSRAGRIGRAAVSLLAEARRRRPDAALLVGFSEFNARLGRLLRQRGVRVLWYAPPQVWAWRPGRAVRLAASCDGMAVILPFEETLWRRAGVAADFVGHPAIERAVRAEEGPEARPSLDRRGGGSPCPVLGLFPGSRDAEARRLAPLLVGAAERLGPRLRARMVLSQSLSSALSRRLARAARRAGVEVVQGNAAERLREMTVAVAASGTVTADCAIAGVPTAIAYRTDPVTFAIARRLVRVPNIGLPNLVLGRRVFPELVQGDCSPDRLAGAVRKLLDDRERYLTECAEVRSLLTPPSRRLPSEHVAELLAPWLDRR